MVWDLNLGGGGTKACPGSWTCHWELYSMENEYKPFMDVLLFNSSNSDLHN